MNNNKLSKKNWFIIIIFCFMGGIAWNTENMYFNTFITNEIYADVSQAAILGSMEATTAVARILALIPLYFLIKKGFDIEEKKNVEVA